MGHPMDFDDLYRDSYQKVYAAALASVGERDTALDVTQEAFTRAFRHWPRLSKELWVEGWVMTTAINLCRRHRRSRVREVLTTVPWGTDNPLSGHSSRMDVLREVSELPTRQRQAVLLYYLADLPIAAIADLMRISEGAVKAHLAQARTRLRQRLEVVDV